MSVDFYISTSLQAFSCNWLRSVTMYFVSSGYPSPAKNAAKWTNPSRVTEVTATLRKTLDNDIHTEVKVTEAGDSAVACSTKECKKCPVPSEPNAANGTAEPSTVVCKLKNKKSTSKTSSADATSNIEKPLPLKLWHAPPKSIFKPFFEVYILKPFQRLRICHPLKVVLIFVRLTSISI